MSLGQSPRSEEAYIIIDNLPFTPASRSRSIAQSFRGDACVTYASYHYHRNDSSELFAAL